MKAIFITTFYSSPIIKELDTKVFKPGDVVNISNRLFSILESEKIVKPYKEHEPKAFKYVQKVI